MLSERDYMRQQQIVRQPTDYATYCATCGTPRDPLAFGVEDYAIAVLALAMLVGFVWFVSTYFWWIVGAVVLLALCGAFSGSKKVRITVEV